MFALDFSKAFDTVKHDNLLGKISLLDISDEVYNWTQDFFEEHSHCTKFDGITSTFIELYASVFQGSGIGPAAFVVNASDLQPANACITLMKYADNTYLIVPASASYSVENELVRIEAWSKENNQQLNQAKSQEIIFAARRKQPSQPYPVKSIRQVESLKVL